jgi:hypothetical protein
MGDRDIFLEKAADCRKRAMNDTAHADHWTDQSINWLQRAAQTNREAVTYEIHNGRMVPKAAK